MTDLSPKNALRMYRMRSHVGLQEQAKAFNKLSLADRLELLFFMLSHQAAATQALHEKIEPGSASTSPMPDLEGMN